MKHQDDFFTDDWVGFSPNDDERFKKFITQTEEQAPAPIPPQAIKLKNFKQLDLFKSIKTKKIHT